MLDRFSGPDRVVIAGLDHLDGTETLLKVVNDVALRSGMAVHLVYVIEPWNAEYANSIYPGEYTSHRVAEFAELKRIQRAEEDLKDMAKLFSAEVKISYGAEIGPAAQTIIQEASRRRASLIACSYKYKDNKFLPRLFSTPLNLMADSPLPVMAIPQGTHLEIDNRNLTIMVCDNLEEASRAAVGTALEFGLALGTTNLMHVHIHPKSESELSQWADEVLSLMAEHRIPTDVNFNPEKIIERTINDVKVKLSARLGLEIDVLETRGHGQYHQVVRFGEVDEQILELSRARNPDLVVFGRHHLIHKRPFSIGKVPFSAMLAVDRPIIVVPSTLQLQ